MQIFPAQTRGKLAEKTIFTLFENPLLRKKIRLSAGEESG
jgi:hypothetical protein